MPDENLDEGGGEAEEMPSRDEVVEAAATVAAMSMEAKKPPSTDLEVRPPSSEVLTPMDPEQVVAAMDAYQALLPKLLVSSDWQKAERDEFVKKSGWRKIARAFCLSVSKVESSIDRDGEGNPLRASATYRAMAPNGQINDGDGYCSAGESRFSTNKAKLEHDMAATATTRAKNRAISDLVGMGEVSAEEVVEGHNAPELPAATDEQKDRLRKALQWLLPDQGEPVWGEIKQAFGGELVGPAAEAVCAVIRAHKANVDAKRAEAEGAKVAEKDAANG